MKKLLIAVVAIVGFATGALTNRAGATPKTDDTGITCSACYSLCQHSGGHVNCSTYCASIHCTPG
jgi:hypothetical protein